MFSQKKEDKRKAKTSVLRREQEKGNTRGYPIDKFDFRSYSDQIKTSDPRL